jgi:hemolysin activation/secretion protein
VDDSGTWRRCAAAAGLCFCLAGGAVAQPAPTADGATAAVDVTAFEVRGHTLIAADRIDAVLAPFKGRRTLAELNEAAQAVQRLYAEAGYGGVVAYVPPQGGGGTIVIAVLEGRVASVQVRGASRYDETRVKAALPDLVVGVTPRLRRIDAQLQLANENPGRQLQVLLKPGSRPGDTEAEIQVNEQPLQRVSLQLDDTGNERTGEYRASATWQHADLSGHDDVLLAQYQTSPTEIGKVTVLSANYRLPVPAWMMALDAFAAYSDVDGGSGTTAAGDLHFVGRGRVFGVRATRYLPRLGETDQRLSIGIDDRRYLNDCAIAGLPDGACGPAGESVAVQPLTLEYSLNHGGAFAWGLSGGLQTNLHLGGRHSDEAAFDAVRSGAKPRYTVVHLSGFAGVAINDDWSLRWRLTAQLTGDALVPGEQFGLGGASSVRGYEEREVAGDSGFAASAELIGPNLLAAAESAAGWVLRPFMFADGGQVRNEDGAPCLGEWTRCTLIGYGLGARLDHARVQVRAALAAAARDGSTTRRHKARAHFAVIYTF